jgi:hypothetical protein
MARNPEPAIRLVAEASQWLDELREALPLLPADCQLEARALIYRLEDTVHTLSFALTAVPLQPAGEDRPNPGAPPGA